MRILSVKWLEPGYSEKERQTWIAVFLAATDSSFQESSLISMLIRNGELTRKLYDEMRNKIWNRSLCHYKLRSFYYITRDSRYYISDIYLTDALFRKFHQGAILDRRFTKRPIIVSQVTDRTQSQLYRPESGLYVIESISFVTMSEKGPVPTSIFRARSIILKYAGRDEERSNRHGWRNYRSDRACVHILWKSKWSRISRYSAVRILGIISIKHRRR